MRRFLLSLSAAGLAFVVAFGLLEVVFRATSPASYQSDPTLTPDGALGWDSVPPVRELPLNTPHAPAVVYLGDSFTQSTEWTAEAQRVLHAQGVATNGFNLGVSGYGTTQQMLKLQRHIDAISPRAIVLLFFAWNDLRDNYPYPEIYYGPQRTTRPYLTTAEGGSSTTPVRWASSLDAGLLRSEVYLRLFNRALVALNARIVSRWPELPATLGWRARLYYEHPVSWQPFYRSRDASSRYVQGAYDVTIEAMRRIREMAASGGADLLVIGIDNSFTVDVDDQLDFLQPNPELDPSLPMQRMAALLGSERIDFINARPRLAALRAAIGRDVYNGPRGGLAGHLGPEGDRLIGAIAAEWLARALAARQPADR